MATTMRALKIQAGTEAQAAVVDDVPIPSPGPGWLLVKTKAVALNPTDWKHMNAVDGPATIGCDFAGIVEKVGTNGMGWNAGDRVCGGVHGSDESHPEIGAFAEFVLTKVELLLRIPDSMTFEAATTLGGIGIITVGQGLYQELGLPLPDAPTAKPFPVLIYGGSSAMGSLGIQFAKCSGLQVITTCSKHNFDYVKKLGADLVFDYKSPTCGADIRKATNNKLYYVWDAISEGTSTQICADALSSDAHSAPGGKLRYASLLMPPCPRADVDSKWTMAYTGFGEETIAMRHKIPVVPGMFEYARHFFTIAQKLLDQGKIVALDQDVRSGGLDGIMDGLQDLKSGKISGKKIVYKV